MLMRLLVCGCMGTARLSELAYSRRNIRTAGPSAEGTWSRRTYPAMVALHAATIGGTALFGRRKPSWPWLAVLAAVQPLRILVLRTLGDRWNTRAAVPEEMSVEIGVPYRFVRHPNYAVVAAELAALPLAFGLPRLALAATIANAALLALRIPEEERLLETLPGYREHFAGKPRFVPGLF